MFKVSGHPVTLWVLFLTSVLCAGSGKSPEKSGDTSHFIIYVTNEKSGDLTEIDSSTLQVIATIPLRKRPRGIHASPDHRFLYIALSGSPKARPDDDESKTPPPHQTTDRIRGFAPPQKQP